MSIMVHPLGLQPNPARPVTELSTTLHKEPQLSPVRTHHPVTPRHADCRLCGTGGRAMSHGPSG